MDIKEIRTLQKTQLVLLNEADRICKLLGINYYLIGGTLLGAIRHGGFIPWDIDIDIAMVRKDYEIFKEFCLKENNNNDIFFYQDYSTEKYHSTRHAIFKLKNTEIKLISHKRDCYKPRHNGIYMDIFPLDFAPNSRIKQKIQQKMIKLFSVLLEGKICKDYGSGKLIYITKSIFSMILKPVSFYKLQKKADKIAQKYNNGECQYIVSMSSHYSYEKQLMPFEIYGEPRKVEFEGREYYAPAKCDEYLRKIYGDYMKLPPEEKRYNLSNAVISVDYGPYKNLEIEK